MIKTTDKLLAKSDGTTLIEHLNDVSKLAAELAADLGLSEDLVEVARVAGLLHDIGKAEAGFQNFLKKKKIEEESDEELEYYEQQIEDKKKLFPLHNEIGWAILKGSCFSFKDNSSNGLSTNIILNTIYWHHGITSQKHQKKYQTVGDIITNEIDTSRVYAQLKELNGESLSIEGEKIYDNEKDRHVPDYVYKRLSNHNDNAKLFAIRACVVKADRLVSIGKKCNYSKKENPKDIKNIKGYNNERFEEQKRLAMQATVSKITQINAPAGFGKTILGLLWHTKLGKKTYWVVPRNTIAFGVYENLIKEIKELELDTSVELFLTGEQKDKNKENTNYDITVTNIDNLMAPIVNMNRAEMAYDSLSSNIIFDEYHEFAQTNGIYAAFLTMMIVRSELIDKTNTLLLSATPSVHSCIWDKYSKNKTLIIGACKAAHDKIYNIEIKDDELPFYTNNSWLYIHNTIKNTQKAWEEDNETKIFHSAYTAKHKEEHNKQLLIDYGKNKMHSNDKVAAAPIIQAALDISFANLAESVLSPESTIQRIGRCNRWGYIKNANLTLYSGVDKSTAVIIDKLYNKKIRAEWIEFAKIELAGQKTLDEIYKAYYDFNERNKNELIEYYKELYDKSLESLSQIIPKRNHKKRIDGKKIATTTPTLRALKPSLFFIVKDAYAKKWLPPDCVMSMDLSELREIALNAGYDMSKIRTIIRDLVKAGYKAFDKKSFDKGVDNGKLLDIARDSETPYPIPTAEMMYYYNENDKRGLVKEKDG
jgi:CRISPR-associated endonuclease/helicase Cas3